MKGCKTAKQLEKIIAGDKMVPDPFLDAHSVFVKCPDFASEKWALVKFSVRIYYFRNAILNWQVVG